MMVGNKGLMIKSAFEKKQGRAREESIGRCGLDQGDIAEPEVQCNGSTCSPSRSSYPPAKHQRDKHIEPVSKRSSLSKVKECENFNRRNTLSILRIEI